MKDNSISSQTGIESLEILSWQVLVIKFPAILGLVFVTTGLSVSTVSANELPTLASDWIEQTTYLGRVGSFSSSKKCREITSLAFQYAALANDQNLKANAHNQDGLCLYGMGRINDSEQQFRTAAEIWKSENDRAKYGIALSNIAMLRVNEGRYGEAISSLRGEIIPILKEKRSLRSEIVALISLSSAEINSGDFSSAQETLAEAEKKVTDTSMEYLRPGIDTNFGYLYLKSGKPSLAIPRFNSGARQYDIGGYKRGSAYATNGSCQALLLLNKIDQSVKCFQSSLTHYSEIPDPTIGAVLRLNYAQALTKSNHCPDAIDSALQALAIAMTSNLRDVEGRAYAAMMECLEQEKKIDSAILIGYEAVAVFRQIRQELSSILGKSSTNYVKRKDDSFRNLSRMLVDQGRIGEAQSIIRELKSEEYFDFTRGQSLLDSGDIQRNPAVEAATNIAVISIEKSEKSRKLLLQQAQGRQLTSTEKATLSALSQKNKEARELFLATLASLATSPDTHTVERARDLKYLDSFRNALRDLGDGTVLLSYIVSDENIVGILTTPSGHVTQQLAINRKDIAQKVFTYRTAIEDYREVSKKDSLISARKLYDILIKPFENDLKTLNAVTIMLSLDGILRYVPFAGLFDGQKFLGEKYALAIYTPAATLSLKDRPRPDWKIAAFGVSKGMQGYRPLVFVNDELSGIIRSNPPWDRGLVSGEVCVNECFTDLKLREVLAEQNYAVIHIASHFIFRPGNESSSFLLLGDGSKLTLMDMRTTDLEFGNVDLLALSACETAVGASEGEQVGVEMEGFSLLAQTQGAKGVLATLWPANDRSTAKFMTAFYSALVSEPRKNKAIALREAQAEVRKLKSEVGDPDFSNPYFWAPFVVIGNWL